jgi:hypothetical protein
MTIWYIFPVLVSCTKKNLATLYANRRNIFKKVMYLRFFFGLKGPSVRLHSSCTESKWKPFKFLKDSYKRTGWPDWVNFLPLGNFLLWVLFSKTTEEANIFGLFFPTVKVMHYAVLTKHGLDYYCSCRRFFSSGHPGNEDGRCTCWDSKKCSKCYSLILGLKMFQMLFEDWSDLFSVAQFKLIM